MVAGAGYLRSEFLALNFDISARNELFDESLEVWGASGRGPLRLPGQALHRAGHVLPARPAQPREPPVLIGGNNALALAAPPATRARAR